MIYHLLPCPREHSRGKFYCCSLCKQSYTKPGRLIQHAKDHLSPCFHCNKYFCSISELQKHYKKEQVFRKFILRCWVCKKTGFSSQHTLFKHLNFHFKAYICKVCRKHFNSPSSLKDHFRIHTKEKPYVCFECARSFSTLGSLKRHQRVHAKEKPHKS